MNMVIVTMSYSWEGGDKSYDMEIPCDVPARILVNHICQTLKNYTSGKTRLSPERLRLFCRRLNRSLEANETFEQAGIWNGDYIDLR